jgi:hypothetical protein
MITTLHYYRFDHLRLCLSQTLSFSLSRPSSSTSSLLSLRFLVSALSLLFNTTCFVSSTLSLSMLSASTIQLVTIQLATSTLHQYPSHLPLPLPLLSQLNFIIVIELNSHPPTQSSSLFLRLISAASCATRTSHVEREVLWGERGVPTKTRELWNICQGSLEEAGRNWKLLRE